MMINYAKEEGDQNQAAFHLSEQASRNIHCNTDAMLQTANKLVLGWCSTNKQMSASSKQNLRKTEARSAR